MSQREYDLYANAIFTHLNRVVSARPQLREGLEKLARACLLRNGPRAARTFLVVVDTAKRFKTPNALIFLRIQASRIATEESEEKKVPRSKGSGSWVSVALIATVVVVAGFFLVDLRAVRGEGLLTEWNLAVYRYLTAIFR